MKKPFSSALAGLAIAFVTGSAPLYADSPEAGGSLAPVSDFYDRVWIEGESGEAKSFAEVADDLSGYDVVFFGEFHGHSGIHLAQMQLFRALHERSDALTLSLEQFERDTQKVVDSYLAGEIGEKAMQEDARAWDNYEQSYRPLVEYAKYQDLPVIAANAPKPIVICVGRQGAETLDEIPEPDRRWVAEELHLDEGAYMDKYRGFMTRSATHRNQADDDGSDAEADRGMSPEMERMVKNSFSAQVT
ncbi:MAG TPA: ChaN family lipoprotein, partial [Wenzhouxiangella sp.]|nr:ChaN family lipoprotein [Wenzhouxiangella sp.]